MREMKVSGRHEKEEEGWKWLTYRRNPIQLLLQGEKSGRADKDGKGQETHFFKSGNSKSFLELEDETKLNCVIIKHAADLEQSEWNCMIRLHASHERDICVDYKPWHNLCHSYKCQFQTSIVLLKFTSVQSLKIKFLLFSFIVLSGYKCGVYTRYSNNSQCTHLK